MTENTQIRRGQKALDDDPAKPSGLMPRRVYAASCAWGLERVPQSGSHPLDLRSHAAVESLESASLGETHFRCGPRSYLHIVPFIDEQRGKVTRMPACEIDRESQTRIGALCLVQVYEQFFERHERLLDINATARSTS